MDEILGKNSGFMIDLNQIILATIIYTYFLCKINVFFSGQNQCLHEEGQGEIGLDLLSKINSVFIFIDMMDLCYD